MFAVEAAGANPRRPTGARRGEGGAARRAADNGAPGMAGVVFTRTQDTHRLDRASPPKGGEEAAREEAPALRRGRGSKRSGFGYLLQQRQRVEHLVGAKRGAERTVGIKRAPAPIRVHDDILLSLLTLMLPTQIPILVATAAAPEVAVARAGAQHHNPLPPGLILSLSF